MQSLSRELADAKVQLSTASRRSRAELEAAEAELEAVRKLLKSGQVQEQQLSQQRDRLEASCGQYETELGAANRRCDQLVGERDQAENRRHEAEAAGAEASAAAAASKGGGNAAGISSSSGCQTDIDERDAELRCVGVKYNYGREFVIDIIVTATFRLILVLKPIA